MNETTVCASCLFQAIDVHAHYGLYRQSPHELVNRLMGGDVETVLRRARLAGTRLTIVSSLESLIPRCKNNPEKGNEDSVRDMANRDGLFFWVVIDPAKPVTFGQAREMLKNPKCAGIKIHPEEHGYRIGEQGRKLFEFAASHRTIILSHSGEANSLPEDFIPWADEFPEMRLILAHLGCGYDNDPGHQVRAIQKSRQGNVFVDTSSATGITSGLLEWAVKEIGAERILYGTDSPLYFAPMQRARIDQAGLNADDKRKIFYRNAEKLFNLEKKKKNHRIAVSLSLHG